MNWLNVDSLPQWPLLAFGFCLHSSRHRPDDPQQVLNLAVTSVIWDVGRSNWMSAGR